MTGMSGAGRSTASWALEDLDWYVIDNLPPGLVRSAVEQVATSGALRVGIVTDIRSGAFFDDVQAALADVQAKGARVSILFLDAPDDVLVRRFEFSRRPHPLQGEGTITDGIAAERDRVAALRAAADLFIDTGSMTPHQLRIKVVESFGGASDAAMHLSITSFGFKHGTPTDADMVFDARFIPNPHWNPRLQPLTGMDAEVRNAIFDNERAAGAFEHMLALIASAVPGYIAEGKRYVSVAVGCTGGRHRSVALAEALAAALPAPGLHISLRHRDLGR